MHVHSSGFSWSNHSHYHAPFSPCPRVCSGHRSAVSCLRFNFTHTQLVSGSKDTHVIVWDTVAEAGLVRYVCVARLAWSVVCVYVCMYVCLRLSWSGMYVYLRLASSGMCVAVLVSVCRCA